MTCREKLEKMNPGCKVHDIIDEVCPSDLGYLPDPDWCNCDCETCWDREIPEEDLCDNCGKHGMACASYEGKKVCPHVPHPFSDRIIMCEYYEPLKNGLKRCTEDPRVLRKSGYAPFEPMGDKEPECVTPPRLEKEEEELNEFEKLAVHHIAKTFDLPEGIIKPSIKDSGARIQFATGAVTDSHDGKGRCDLMPLDVVAGFRGQILNDIYDYQTSGDPKYLKIALQKFIDKYMKDMSTALLEVSIHFEEGAKKYGEHNWQKGIPTHRHIDSAVRHYLKFMRGDKDEPHDRAFIWRLLCCIWTCIHKPELNDYSKENKEVEES